MQDGLCSAVGAIGLGACFMLYCTAEYRPVHQTVKVTMQYTAGLLPAQLQGIVSLPTAQASLLDALK